MYAYFRKFNLFSIKYYKTEKSNYFLVDQFNTCYIIKEGKSITMDFFHQVGWITS